MIRNTVYCIYKDVESITLKIMVSTTVLGSVKGMVRIIGKCKVK